MLVSLGSISGDHGKRFFGAAMEGLAAEPVQLIVGNPQAEAEGVFGNAIVRRWLPILTLTSEHVQAVLGHSGGTTLHEALSHGVPLVVAPVRDDQGVFAARAQAVGAAIRIRYARSTPAEIRDAVMTILNEPCYAARARHMQLDLQKAGGAAAAASALAELVAENASV